MCPGFTAGGEEHRTGGCSRARAATRDARRQHRQERGGGALLHARHGAPTHSRRDLP